MQTQASAVTLAVQFLKLAKKLFVAEYDDCKRGNRDNKATINRVISRELFSLIETEQKAL